MSNEKEKKLINYWVESSDDDFETMMAMYNSKRYNWTLYVGHLMIEKLLKAYYVQVRHQSPPFIHNLLRLAEKCGLKVNEGLKADLAVITAFNISTRYDDYKKSFQKMCTPEYTKKWVDKLNNIRQWIKTQIKL